MRPSDARHRVLFVSNGHGEDSIAATIIDRLRSRHPEPSRYAQGERSLELSAWPMVGLGDALRSREIPIRGVANTLPSEGFATLSADMMWGDLRAGWIATHWRQVQAARAMRGAFDLVVAVGDVVPVIAARLMGAPFLFVGCAKSEYYAPRYRYSRYEIATLRRAAIAFPRDERTTRMLESRGVHARYVGNPMMDQLQPTGEMFDTEHDAVVIACLPGSRGDAPQNARRILDLLVELGQSFGGGRPLCGIFALPPQFSLEALAVDASWRHAAANAADAGRGIVMRLEHETSRARAVLVRGRLADALHRAHLVIGLAGTANEQAVGLGKPLVTFATDGTQGRAYLRMKMTYFGDSALEISAEPRAAAREIQALLDDPGRQAVMAAAGRERMGMPGAAHAIASEIRTLVTRE